MQPDSQTQIDIAEYQATQDCFFHYDNWALRVIAMLLAGVFIFFGLLIEERLHPRTLVFALFFVNFLMSVWILYAQHNRKIFFCKLHRIWELERKLGMEQHRRFVDNQNTAIGYKYSGVFGATGRHFDMAIYVIVCGGGLFLGLMEAEFNLWILSTLAVPIITISFYFWYEWPIDDLIEWRAKTMEKTKGTISGLLKLCGIVVAVLMGLFNLLNLSGITKTLTWEARWAWPFGPWFPKAGFWVGVAGLVLYAVISISELSRARREQ